jgi:hypothetical protein
MEWKRIKDERPPKNVWILLARVGYDGREVSVAFVRVKNPFSDGEEIYNPNFFCYQHVNDDDFYQFRDQEWWMHIPPILEVKAMVVPWEK